MDRQKGDVLLIQRPNSSLLRCKRHLDFGNPLPVSKRSRADVVAGEDTLKTVEKDEPKEEESINQSVVLGPLTPLPAIRKRVSVSGSSMTCKTSRSKSKYVIKHQKDSVQEVSELAKNSIYYTRSLNLQVSNAFKLIDVSSASVQVKHHGRRVTLKLNKKQISKTTSAWRVLLMDATAKSRDRVLEKDGSISVKAQSFVSKVGTIQGQREYFPWKGSVLDSVIGAFLTQRVGDNFSSSAFMSLGVSFPQYWDHGKDGTYTRHHRMLREKRTKCGSSRKGRSPRQEKIKLQWKISRTHYSVNSEERTMDTIDFVDWDRVMRADVKDISNAIKIRGMNKKLAKRIKEFLCGLEEDLGNLDLEWVRNVPPLKAKELLLNIHGLGPKCVDCIQLLTLKQPAFPVDVNVARVTVRLGWVPAPLDTSDKLQMTVLEQSSALHNLISQYLFLRLCRLDQKTLYKLHYHMITFGKVFCTKQNPNCAECPMRMECKHAQMDIEDLGSIRQANNQMKSMTAKRALLKSGNEKKKGLENDPEQYCHKGDVEAPITPMKDQSLLKMGSLGQNNVKASSSTKRQLKNSRTSTQHFVYELHDCDPILEKFEDRDPDDSSPYLLLTWESDEIDKTGHPLANSKLSSSLSPIKKSHTVSGTIMIPFRTALRGSFPLNGTYFQINEVFADQKTSQVPVDVDCKMLQYLRRKVLYCGSDLSNIAKDDLSKRFISDLLYVKGFSKDEVHSLFNEGYICTRGFDRETLAPVALERRLHKLSQNKIQK